MFESVARGIRSGELDLCNARYQTKVQMSVGFAPAFASLAGKFMTEFCCSFESTSETGPEPAYHPFPNRNADSIAIRGG